MRGRQRALHRQAAVQQPSRRSRHQRSEHLAASGRDRTRPTRGTPQRTTGDAAMRLRPGRSDGTSTHGNAAVKQRGEDQRYRRAAVVVAVLLAACFYAAFFKQLPFTSHFTMRADFATANELEPGNPVRIAGLDIGKVSGVSAGPDNTSIVSMEIDDPSELHADA